MHVKKRAAAQARARAARSELSIQGRRADGPRGPQYDTPSGEAWRRFQGPQGPRVVPADVGAPPAGAKLLSLDAKRFQGLSDGALLEAIRRFAAPHRELGYDAARKLIFTDLDNHGGKVRDVYTGREILTGRIPGADGPTGMNVEHTWPKSLGVKGTPARSDLHHLFPVDTQANSIRSSFPFGVVKTTVWSQGGSRFGRDALGHEVFEPRDNHKGDVARAMFYVADIYGLRIPNDEEAVLKAWNHADPVDDAERGRNRAIRGLQGNTNPFVDDPSLADRIQDF